MRWVTCLLRVQRRLAIELPACTSPSSTPWHASRVAARSSSNSCCEELWAIWTACVWVTEFPRAFRRPESQNTNQVGSESRTNQTDK
jgi:hypothetical protein